MQPFLDHAAERLRVPSRRGPSRGRAPTAASATTSSQTLRQLRPHIGVETMDPALEGEARRASRIPPRDRLFCLRRAAAGPTITTRRPAFFPPGAGCHDAEARGASPIARCAGRRARSRPSSPGSRTDPPSSPARRGSPAPPIRRAIWRVWLMSPLPFRTSTSIFHGRGSAGLRACGFRRHRRRRPREPRSKSVNVTATTIAETIAATAATRRAAASGFASRGRGRTGEARQLPGLAAVDLRAPTRSSTHAPSASSVDRKR